MCHLDLVVTPLPPADRACVFQLEINSARTCTASRRSALYAQPHPFHLARRQDVLVLPIAQARVGAPAHKLRAASDDTYRAPDCQHRLPPAVSAPANPRSTTESTATGCMTESEDSGGNGRHSAPQSSKSERRCRVSTLSLLWFRRRLPVPRSSQACAVFAHGDAAAG